RVHYAARRGGGGVAAGGAGAAGDTDDRLSPFPIARGARWHPPGPLRFSELGHLVVQARVCLRRDADADAVNHLALIASSLEFQDDVLPRPRIGVVAEGTGKGVVVGSIEDKSLLLALEGQDRLEALVELTVLDAADPDRDGSADDICGLQKVVVAAVCVF